MFFIKFERPLLVKAAIQDVAVAKLLLSVSFEPKSGPSQDGFTIQGRPARRPAPVNGALFIDASSLIQCIVLWQHC